MKSILFCSLLLFGLGVEVKVQCQENPCFRTPQFTFYGDRCYLFVLEEENWADAETSCNQYNGHLASLRTQDEYYFIRALIYRGAKSDKPSWVGGTDAAKEGVWVWSDGSPFKFTGWAAGEPNNQGGNEHCMQVNLLGYDYVNDLSCGVKQSFVCARTPDLGP